ASRRQTSDASPNEKRPNRQGQVRARERSSKAARYGEAAPTPPCARIPLRPLRDPVTESGAGQGGDAEDSADSTARRPQRRHAPESVTAPQGWPSRKLFSLSARLGCR